MPPALPVVVRASWLPETILGQCLRRDKRFVVLLNDKMGEPRAVEVLCHEWAHAVAWNFSVDRLINAPDTDPVAFERACHDEAWDSAYSRVWRAYLDVIREAA
jgi:Zn-dependent peptidase ImmA (M78 family)